MSQVHIDLPVALWNRIVILANQDAELRVHLRNLSLAALTATEVQRQASEEEQSSHQDVPATASAATVQEVAGSTRLPELTLGRSVSPVKKGPLNHLVPRETDFTVIESRCRLKAEGARWAATRRRMLAEGADFYTEVDPVDRNIFEKANKFPDCFLWMCHPSGPSPASLSLYEELADCFDVLADAVSLIKQILDESKNGQREFEQALDLLAEAQSAVRIAIVNIEGNPDTDQCEVFHWLRRTAYEQQILIQRYMKLNDPADPSQVSELAERIEAMDESVQQARQRARQQKKLLGKIRHKTSLIASDPDNSYEHWRILVATVDVLVSDGLPPSNLELRESLLPVIDNIPDLSEIPQGFQLVLREIDRFMASCPPPESPAVTPPSQEVLKTARLLNGRAMVLIGGHRRLGAARALKEAFGLSELLWIETQEHESIDRFESYVARSDVAVVLLAIRWSSHSFGEVGDFCDKYDKPLVRLPRGYNPNQVAAQILSQCSDRLGQ